MRPSGRVRVWKHPVGLFAWDCDVESCKAQDSARHGASLFWEIAQNQADDHAREWHVHTRRVPHDVPTPPGGLHFEWSDTGMHVRIPDQRGGA